MDTKETCGVVELSSGVYWVGAIDWNGRNFHGFTIPGRTTYNSYLVTGKKTALIDTVKTPLQGRCSGASVSLSILQNSITL